MKRISGIVIFIAVFLFILLPPAYASTDKAFTTVRLNKFGSVAIVLGNKFGFDIGGFIVPFFNKEGNMATPDFYPGADFKGSISEYTMPQSKIDLSKIIPWNEQLNPVILTALYGAILKTDAEHSNHPEPTDCYISQGLETSAPNEHAPEHFWNGQFLNAMYGIREITPPDSSGVIDFNRGQQALAGMNPAEDCKKHNIGFEREKLENDLKKLSQFGDGTMIEGQEMTTIMKIVEFFNKLTGKTELREEPETEPHKDDVILTKDQKLPWYNFMCNDYWCPGNETGDDSSGTEKTGGWTNFLLPVKDQAKVMAASVQSYGINVLGFPQKPLEASYDAFNQSQVGMQKAGCYATPYTPKNNLQEEAAIGGLIKIQDECQPLTTLCDEADTWDEIVQKLQKSLNDAANEYAAYFPISSSQLVDLMNVIFTIEVGNDPTISGANYRCEENSATAAGPFQIKTETYGDITNNCEEEYMPDDLTGCKTKETQLSRCITEDAAVLAIRAMLYSAGRWVHTPNQCTDREFRIANMSELYTAVCNYGEGDTILPHLGNKTYCEYVFDTLGWTKP